MTVKLKAYEGYHPEYVPEGAKKAYVARILGRHAIVTFQREFLGKDVELDDPGLYEVRDVNKRGTALEPDFVVLLDSKDDVDIYYVTRADAMKIARRFDEGVDITDIVHLVNGEAEVMTAAQAQRRKKAATLESAIDSCWQILQLLPGREARKALSELRKRVPTAAQEKQLETAE